MKTVEISISSTSDQDASGNSVHVESKRGDIWARVDGRDVVTNKEKNVKFQLRPGQRLVIEASPAPELVYDRLQGAAVDPSKQKGNFDPQKGEVSDKAHEENQQPDSTKKTAEQEKARLDKAADQNAGQTAVGDKPPLTTDESMLGAGREKPGAAASSSGARDPASGAGTTGAASPTTPVSTSSGTTKPADKK